jgi:hypothetical protein
MKNIKLLFFIICLIFFLDLIFCTPSFATIYVVKDQDGNHICITNQEDLISQYENLGYVIWILDSIGLTQKSLEPEPMPDDLHPQFTPESLYSESQIKGAPPLTTEAMPTLEIDLDREKMIKIFKANALTQWGNNFAMVNYEVRLQTEAYDWMVKQTEHTDIITRAQKNWDNDYTMVKYEYQQQIEAYNWIDQQEAYPEIMSRAKQERADDYMMVKYEYEQQVEAYEWLQKNKDRNPEAYEFASSQWGNDYEMVKYQFENY